MDERLERIEAMLTRLVAAWDRFEPILERLLSRGPMAWATRRHG